jgi:hypothetical protein
MNDSWVSLRVNGHRFQRLKASLLHLASSDSQSPAALAPGSVGGLQPRQAFGEKFIPMQKNARRPRLLSAGLSFTLRSGSLALALGLALAFSAPRSAQAQTTLYAVTGDGGSPSETLFILDQTTAAPTLVQALGNGADGEAIAFNSNDGLMYHTSGNGTVIFESINLTTMAVTNIPRSGASFNEVFGMVYDPSQNNFIISDIGSQYLRITPEGVATLIGNHGIEDIRGLAITCDGVYGVNPFSNELYLLDIDTGAVLAGPIAMTSDQGTVTGANGLAAHPDTGDRANALKINV